MQFGLSRLFAHFSADRNHMKNFSRSIQDQYMALELTTQSIDTAIEEFMLFDRSTQQLRLLGSHFGNIPLTVITASIREFWEEVGFTRKQSSEMFTQFEALQKELLNKSNHSNQVFAITSDHMIPRNQPEIIIETIREHVQKVRKANEF